MTGLRIGAEDQGVYVCMTVPDSGGPYSGYPFTIFVKGSSMGAIPDDRGRPVIRKIPSPSLNSATSTRQSVSSACGMVVMAGNDATQRYWHADLPLGLS